MKAVSILGWPDGRATVQYNTVHNSAGHGGQGERRREDEGRMGGVQGVGRERPKIHCNTLDWKCECECVCECERLWVRGWTLVMCEASKADACRCSVGSVLKVRQTVQV